MDQRLSHFGGWRDEPYRPNSGSFGSFRFELRHCRHRPKLSILRIFVLLLVGVPLWYYYNYFCCIRYFEDPLQGLVFVEEASPLQYFSKTTVAKILDPTLVELERLRVIRKSTRQGTFSSPELERRLAEVRAQVQALSAEARLRRIPLIFKKEYTQSLLALHDLLRSVNVLEDALACSNEEERGRLYIESVKYAKMSKRKWEQARGYFVGWEPVHLGSRDPMNPPLQAPQPPALDRSGAGGGRRTGCDAIGRMLGDLSISEDGRPADRRD